KEQHYLNTGERTEELFVKRIVLTNKPVTKKQHGQDKRRDRNQLAKTATCVLGKLEIWSILNEVHTAKQIRHLYNDKTQKQKIEKSEDDADLDRAKRKCRRQQRIVEVCQVQSSGLLFGFWFDRRVGRIGLINVFQNA